ncbi:putative reverse transcriptase domain-containing protein [Tanacetum coccineum]
MKLSMKKLEILKKNIKFRGGLLGLKDFLMILELLLLRAYAAGPSKSMVDLCQNVPSASTIIMRTTRANPRGNVCYECGAHGHFKRECPKLKNNNRGNQGGNGNAPAKVYMVGNAGTRTQTSLRVRSF